MTDKALLELAAKAAGIKVARFDGKECGYYVDGCLRNWNPLTNDGDALRLAVKLHIHIRQAKTILGDAVQAGYIATDIQTNFINEYIEADPYAATRRAIVRAAAEIGRMK